VCGWVGEGAAGRPAARIGVMGRTVRGLGFRCRSCDWGGWSCGPRSRRGAACGCLAGATMQGCGEVVVQAEVTRQSVFMDLAASAAALWLLCVLTGLAVFQSLW
jgi:hypothetical protein